MALPSADLDDLQRPLQVCRHGRPAWDSPTFTLNRPFSYCQAKEAQGRLQPQARRPRGHTKPREQGPGVTEPPPSLALSSEGSCAGVSSSG